jgi:hypothetical protein
MIRVTAAALIIGVALTRRAIDRSLEASRQAVLERDRQRAARQLRIAQVEDAANTRIHDGLTRADTAAWETEMWFVR